MFKLSPNRTLGGGREGGEGVEISLECLLYLQINTFRALIAAVRKRIMTNPVVFFR